MNNNNKPAAIILAAGTSSRMGENKMLKHWRGKPLLTYAMNAAMDAKTSGMLAFVAAVCGRDNTQTAKLAAAADIVINNADYQSGIASSLICGINALPKQCPAALVMLGDMPSIRRADIAAVIDKWNETNADIIAAAHNGKRGHPVLLSAQTFPRIRTLSGDTGARDIFAEFDFCPANAGRGVLMDIDTPEQIKDTTTKAAV